MKYTYQFNNGETSEIEVTETDALTLETLDRLEYNNDHKETRRHTHLDTEQDASDWLAVEDENLAALFADTPDEIRLRTAIAKLKPKQQSLVQALYFDGIPVKEYAAREGVDHSAITHRMETIVKKLKNIF
ncbi:hypothetical protein FACS1894196_4420 [Clostridia bacterium]|nr:hypothetical protein FACS1894196_4420 [Clostridia bacterium]